MWTSDRSWRSSGAAAPDKDPRRAAARGRRPCRASHPRRSHRRRGDPTVTRSAFPTTWGANLLADGRARFRLWAPDEPTLCLRTPEGDIAMEPAGGGWFEIVTDKVPVGGAYAFVLPDGFAVPDPAARAQAGSVHGPSKLVDPAAYAWRTDWTGRPWEEARPSTKHTPGHTDSPRRHPSRSAWRRKITPPRLPSRFTPPCEVMPDRPKFRRGAAAGGSERPPLLPARVLPARTGGVRRSLTRATHTG